MRARPGADAGTRVAPPREGARGVCRSPGRAVHCDPVGRRLRTLLKVLAVVAALVVVAAAVGTLALPGVIRRVAVQKIPEFIGREARIDDVDLNLFTGRFAVRGIRLAERDPRDAFVQVGSVEGRVWLPALVTADIRLLELRVVDLAARVIRTGPDEFNFSDLLAIFSKVDPAAKPSRWTFTIDRLALERGRVIAEDRAVSPAANWSIDPLEGSAAGITKRAGADPGRGEVRMKLGGLEVRVAADQVRLAPVSIDGKITVTGFDLTRVRPYVPATVPFVAESGTLGMALSVAWKREPGRIDVARVAGDVTLQSLAVSRAGAPAPFVQVPRLAVRIAEADAIQRRLAIASLEVEGLDLKAERDAGGKIDLLAALEKMRARAETGAEAPPATPPVAPAAAPEGTPTPSAPEAAAPPAAPAPSAPRGPPAPASGPAWQVRIDKVAVRSSAATLTDQMVAPAVDWRVEGLTVEAAALDTASKDARGTVAIATDLLASSAPAMRTRVTVDVTAIGLAPLTASGKIAVKGFDEVSTNPYVPIGMPAAVTAGIIDLEADVAVPLPSRAGAPGEAAGAAPPIVVEVPRFSITSERLTVEDLTLAPPRPWDLTKVRVTGAGLSNSPDDPPANVVIEALVGPPGVAKPASLRMQADAVRVIRRASRVRTALAGFELAWLEPYVPPAMGAVPHAGLLTVNLDSRIGRSRTGAPRARTTGTALVTDAGVLRRGETVPFLSVPRVAVAIKQADALRRTVDLSSVDVGAFKVRATRGPDGRIDLLELHPAAAPVAVPGPAAAVAPVAAAGPTPATAAAAGATPGPWKLNVDRLNVTGGTAEFVDLQVSPNVALVLTDIDVNAMTLTWPVTTPAIITVGMGMPGGGRTDVRLTGILDPLDIQLRTVTRDAPIDLYHPYFPFPARFRGKFHGDSLSEVKRDGDVLRAASRGTGWATELAVDDPESQTPVLLMERMEIRGIDFSWPNYALVDRVSFTKPNLRVERTADGTINLRRLFTPPKKDGEDTPAEPSGPAAPPAATPTAAPAEPEAPREPTLLETIVLDFTEIALEQGQVRFLDRTTTPAYAEEMRQLEVRIRGLSNVFGRQQTQMTMSAIAGDDAHVDMRGELSGIGETLRADLVGEIRNFDLTSANPYADSLTSWVVERGTLAAKIHYRVEGDRITAEHDVNFGGLKVAKSKGDDEAKKRLGLPLGLVVGLMKDTRGNIDFDLPLSGTLSDRSFNWGETVWAGVKQSLLKVLAGPFRAIGRLFTGGDKVDERAADLQVEPITFDPGSAVVAPAMEQHLAKVAGFLRRSPFVGLSMVPVATGPDVASLRSQALNAKIVALQEERKLKDFPAAVRAYYRAQKIAGDRPKTVEEQVAVLLEREPTPDDTAVSALQDRRLQATRDALARQQGIPADRLVAGAPKSVPSETAEGRVEFSLLAD